MAHPDIWPGALIQDLDEIPAVLRHSPFHPDRTVDRYSYRELRQFADLIQDRFKQSPTIGKVEQSACRKRRSTSTTVGGGSALRG